MPPSPPLPGDAEAAHAERLFALSQDLLGAADADGHLRWVNAAWQRTTGWTPAELYAHPYVEFLHPDDRAKVIAFAERLEHMPPGESLQIEARARRRDGSYRWLRFSAAVTDGPEPLVYLSATDVTDLHRGARTARGRADALGQAHRGARALQRRARALRVGRLARPAPVADRGLRVPRAAGEPPRRRAGAGRGQVARRSRVRAASGCTRWSRTCSRTRAWGTRRGAPERVDAGELVRRLAPTAAAGAHAGDRRAARRPRAPARVRATAGEPDRQRGQVRRAAACEPVVNVSATRDGAGWRFEVADNGIGVPPRTRSGSSACSPARPPASSTRGPASAWRSPRKSSRARAAGSGCAPARAAVACSASPGQQLT